MYKVVWLETVWPGEEQYIFTFKNAPIWFTYEIQFSCLSILEYKFLKLDLIQNVIGKFFKDFFSLNSVFELI